MLIVPWGFVIHLFEIGDFFLVLVCFLRIEQQLQFGQRQNACDGVPNAVFISPRSKTITSGATWSSKNRSGDHKVSAIFQRIAMKLFSGITTFTTRIVTAFIRKRTVAIAFMGPVRIPFFDNLFRNGYGVYIHDNCWCFNTNVEVVNVDLCFSPAGKQG